jgi:hypothetical protein
MAILVSSSMLITRGRQPVLCRARQPHHLTAELAAARLQHGERSRAGSIRRAKCPVTSGAAAQDGIVKNYTIHLDEFAEREDGSVFSDHELRARLRPRDSRRSTSSVLTNLAAAPGVGPTGRDRCLPRANHRRQGHRLGPHRRALRRPGSNQPLPRRRAKPRRRGRPGVRPSGGAGHRAAPVRRRRASPVPPVAGGRRRPALPHRGHGRARQHFLQAASLTNNTRERATMQRRAAECAAQHAGESSV